MLTFLFYRPENDPPLDASGCAAICEDLGIQLAVQRSGAYWHGVWTHHTGAQAQIDCGDPGLEEDHLHPPRSFPGWRELPLRVQVPLLGPHWFCSEALSLIETIHQQIPEAGLIDCDDPELGEEHGPGPLARSASLDRWCELMALHGSGRQDLRRMNRLSSMALWRYRREAPAGESMHSDLHWPLVHILGDLERAYTAVLWSESTQQAALPPIDLIVLPVEDAPCILLGEHVLTRSPQDIGHGACRIVDKATIEELCHSGHARHCASELHPLDDADWTDQ